MRVAIEHNTTRIDARQIVEAKIGSLMRQFSQQADTVDKEWIGDTLHFRGKAHGLSLKGTVEVTETEVIIDGHLPLLAMPFESRIKQTVEREAEAMFRQA